MASPTYFKIRLGLNASEIQGELISALKNIKADVIQTADGLVIRYASPVDQLNRAVDAIDPVLKAEPLDLESLSRNPHTPKDLLAFTGLK